MYEPKGPETVKFDFEDGMDGWELEGGTFGRRRAPEGQWHGLGASGYALFSSSCVHQVCDHVESPPIIMTSQSTLSIDTSFITEATTEDGGTLTLYYDGEYHSVIPSGGRLYDRIADDDEDGIDGFQDSCDLFDVELSGWTHNHGAGYDDDDSSQYWATSTFNAASLGLNLSPGQQKTVRIAVFHATDYEDCAYRDDDDWYITPGVTAYFAIDNIEVTNAILDVPEEAEFWYPDYETSWDRATCLNTLPLPFTTGGRPTYDSKDACCANAYRGQVSNACCAPNCLLTTVEFDFNTGNDGWSNVDKKSGSLGFVRADKHRSRGHAMFHNGCELDACSYIKSPVIMMSSKSSLSMTTSFTTEDGYDGGSVSLYYNGEHHHIRPSSGRLYTHEAISDDDGVDGLSDSDSCNGPYTGGWATEDEYDWETSTFSSSELNLPLGPNDAIEVEIFVFFASDGGSCEDVDDDTNLPIGDGYFGFDDVKVTEAYLK
jgi:hypothetical protein